MMRNNGDLAGGAGNSQHPSQVQAARPPPLTGIKRHADELDDIEEDSDEEFTSSEDSVYEPPPRSRGPGPRGLDGGLRSNPAQVTERYWDHENHMAACRAELAELAEEGVTFSQIDASEGDSDCEIESEDDDEEEDENAPNDESDPTS
jgi:hypothetical protein